MPYGILAADQISTSVTGVSLGAGNATRFKNRIINGDMRIDQRNAGASQSWGSTTVAGNYYGYSVDRWQIQSYTTTAGSGVAFTTQQNAGSVTPPAGYINYLGATVTTSQASLSAITICRIFQRIEGLNCADLGWGTANAKTITLSAWVYSSLTGTFGGSLLNSASNRCYPFSYTISSANTWTQVSITIAGDTTGTWLTTNGIGIDVTFSLGANSANLGTAGSWGSTAYYGATGQTNVVSTNGATFYITGVQLEVGSSATGFDYVDYTTQLAMCQRYFEMSYNYGNVPGTATRSGGLFTNAVGGALNRIPSFFKVTKRAPPTITLYASESGASANVTQWTSGGATGNLGATAYDISDEAVARVEFTTSASNVFASWNWTASIEL